MPGGVEFGFMSTTARREVAVQYTAGKEMPTIFEIAVGQVDRGATIDFVSQYPSEAEILFPPLSNMEVVDKPRLKMMPGGRMITVVSIRINSNSMSRTLDQMEAQRKHLHMNLLRNLVAETERQLRGGSQVGDGMGLRSVHDLEEEQLTGEGGGEMDAEGDGKGTQDARRGSVVAPP